MLFSYNPIYLPKILQIGTKANKSMRQLISAVKDNCYISLLRPLPKPLTYSNYISSMNEGSSISVSALQVFKKTPFPGK